MEQSSQDSQWIFLTVFICFTDSRLTVAIRCRSKKLGKPLITVYNNSWSSTTLVSGD